MDAFYQVIPFGTGGRRGLVGIGPNRINKWTIQSSAQGHSQYLVKKYGATSKQKGIVITFDVRKYTQKSLYNDNINNPVMNLDCAELAQAAAEVYAANGIKVYIFDSPRSTPELSFAIRHLKAIGGDMISASHNAPTDNGKKIYDQFGGQLIPPHDQELVDVVTKEVKEIKSINFDKAKEQGTIEIIGEEVDNAYIDAVCKLSLSEERDVKIVYSPLHGTGITSFYPVLKKLKFDITLDPKTSNPSGKFENVTFNIPNPEVVQSFDTPLAFAKKENADLLINSDPDSDRIGAMVKHEGKWKYLNGNEIGIILTEYGISKFKEKNRLNKNSTIIKTDVTSSLIAKICAENQVNCIGDLLVGFKYIGEEMNKLESSGKIDDFILGTEESHGYIIGNYARDKDAAGAAVWISELSAELKKEGKTLVDYLNSIYSRYGYCNNYLTEIKLPGADGMEKISKIQNNLREKNINNFGDFQIEKKIDRWDGEPHKSLTDTASRNVLQFLMKPPSEIVSIRVTVRPSGTEPKIKMYFEIISAPCSLEKLSICQEKINALKVKFEREVMKYCYRALGVEFPNRGFLLFWQMPLNDKMKYFEIEKEITDLKNIQNMGERKEKLFTLLEFLGSNPVEKVNEAFKAEYKTGLLEYLELN
jgi:phosphoglucomutase/phosphomannomutase